MIITSRQSVKPPLGSCVDFGHPLAKDIITAFTLNESGGGIAVDSVNGFQLVASGGARFGKNGLICDALYGGADMLANNKQKLSGNISIIAGIVKIGTAPAFASFCGTDYGTGGSPYVGYAFDHDALGRVGCSINNGSSFVGAGHVDSLTNFKPYVLGMSFVPGTSLKFFQNGILQDSVSPGGSNVSYSSSRFHCGVRSTDAQLLNKIINFWYVFNRELSDKEFKEFYINPYQIFRPRQRRFISIKASSISSTFNASALTSSVSVQSPAKVVTILPSARTITISVQTAGKIVVRLPSAFTLTVSTQTPTKQLTFLATQLSAILSTQSPSKKITVTPSAVSMLLNLLSPSLTGSGGLTVSVGALSLIAAVLSPGKVVTKTPSLLTVTVETKGVTVKTVLPVSALSILAAVKTITSKVTIFPAAQTMTASTGIPVPVNKLSPAVLTAVAAVLGPSIRIDKVLIVNALTMAIQVKSPVFDLGGNFIHITGPDVRAWIKQEISYKKQIQIKISYKG